MHLLSSRQPASPDNTWPFFVDALADVVWTTDNELKITYLNGAATRLFGYKIDEMLGKSFINFCSNSSADDFLKKIDEENKKEYLANNDPHRMWTIETNHVCNGGMTMWTETKMGFMRGLKGESTGYIGVSRDITERLRRDNRTQQSRVMAFIGEMTSAIASEINNPVGGILLSSEQLMLADLSQQVKKDLSLIHGEAKRVSRMMSGLLNSCNLAPRNMEKFKINRIINKVLEIRKYAHHSHNICVSTDLQKITIYVMCDPYNLQQVFTRLIQDAESALNKRNGGNIVVTSRKQGEWVKVIVADDRPAVFSDYPGRAWPPILDLPATGPDITRLDMILCHAIVTAHGGQLYSESNRMGGNSFVVELPIYKSTLITNPMSRSDK